MIASPPTVYDQGDLIGFQIQVIIVAVVIILGLVSLINWGNREAALQDQADDIAEFAESLYVSGVE